MAFDRIEMPMLPTGSEQQQLEQTYRFLCRLVDDLNLRMEKIGDNGLTDSEMKIMNAVMAQGSAEGPLTDQSEAESLKSMIIKTASFVQSSMDEYRTNLFRNVINDGKFGKYVRQTGMDVAITPEGTTQSFTLQEIVQGLRQYEINAKNYIKTGLLRYENGVPVYGVAIGKDVVTFDEHGQETYHDGNKVAELSDNSLSFYSNGALNAKYSASGIVFYDNGDEVLRIENGDIYVIKNLYMDTGKSITMNLWNFSEEGANYNDGELILGNAAATHVYNRIAKAPSRSNGIMFTFGNDNQKLYFDSTGEIVFNGGLAASGSFPTLYSPNDLTIIDFTAGYFNTVHYKYLMQQSSRDIKHGIEDLAPPGEKLDRLRPVTFIYDEDATERRRAGLIYEETEGILPEICTENEGYKALNYMELVPYLLKEIQGLRSRVKALEERGGN